MYNYKIAMEFDIRNFLMRDNNLRDFFMENNRDGIDVLRGIEDICNDLYEALLYCSSVTGHTASYGAFSHEAIKEYVVDNICLLVEAAEYFDIDSTTIGNKLLNDDWEYFDITIRRYILSDVLRDFVERARDQIKESLDE